MERQAHRPSRRGLIALAAGAAVGLTVAAVAFAGTRPSAEAPAGIDASAAARSELEAAVSAQVAADDPALLAWDAPAVPKVKPKVRVVQSPPKVVYVAAETPPADVQPARASDDDSGYADDDHGDDGDDDHGDDHEDEGEDD